MGRILVCAALLLSAGCSETKEDHQQVSAGPPKQEARQAAAPAGSAAAKAYLLEEESDFLEFSYGWPAEAAAIPKLTARFQAELEKQRSEARKEALEDKEARGPDAPYNSHSFSKVWSSLGQTNRFLSLAAEVGTFTGGAHGSAVYDVILWDRQADVPVELSALFGNAAAAFEAMTPVYCRELDRQRAEKRQGQEAVEDADWMTQCRPLGEQVIAPVDANGDRRFELFRVLIEPYNAGPYSEGTYEVDIPVTDAVRKLVKQEFASAF